MNIVSCSVRERELEVRLTQLFQDCVLKYLRDFYKETGHIA